MRLPRAVFACLLLGNALAPAWSQQYVISTYAGGGPLPTPSPGLHMWIGLQRHVATDAEGNVFFNSLNSVLKLDTGGVVTRVTGTSRPGFSGDGGPATSALLHDPAGLAVDSKGNLFIADAGNDRIRRVSRDGVITKVAGNGTFGFSGDGGLATNAQLGFADPGRFRYGPLYVAVDGKGNLFIADYQRVRKVSVDGIIGTVVEKASGPLAVDTDGNLFVANGNVVVKVSSDGTLSTVAGGGRLSGNTLGFTGLSSSACVDDLSGDGGPATQTGLCTLTGIAVDGAGNLFVGEHWLDDVAGEAEDWALRKVSPDGIITTTAGNTHDWAKDGGLATAGLIGFGGEVAVDRAGNLFITDIESIRRISPDGIINTVAGGGSQKPQFSGDGGPAASAILSGPSSVAVDWTGNLFIADSDNLRVRKITPDGIITTVAGGGTQMGPSADGGPATSASLSWTYGFSNGGLAADRSGNLFIEEGGRIRRVSPDGIITTVAGGGALEGASADGGPATNAHFGKVGSIATDGSGNLYVAEPDAHRVRKVTPGGIVSTFAGTGTEGYSGDGGLAVRAQLDYPIGVAVDDAGRVFIAVRSGPRIRVVTPDGIIATVAGNGILGFSGDGGPATGAALAMNGIAVDALGNLFIATFGSGSIRQITPDGIINTVAGSHEACCYGGYAGDDGPATQGRFSETSSVAVDRAGNVYVADKFDNVVRVLRPVRGPAN